MSSSTPSLQSWQAITQDPRVVEFVRGVFGRLGIVVKDTAERFTCVQQADRIEFEDRLEPSSVDYSVEVDSAQVQRLAEHANRGEFDAAEKFRITRTLFTPATASTLTTVPVLSNPLVRWLSGAESLIHVRLKSPVSDEPDAAHTLTYADGRWTVTPGLHGEPKRTFTLSTDQAMDYQRRVFAAVKANSFGGWLKFGLWYRGWRKTVSQAE